MFFSRRSPFFCLAILALSSITPLSAQSVDEALFEGLHWRMIGPHRGGRTKVVAGVPQQAGVFYTGYVNGGVYPNRDKPRGYEQYTWLLEHFIRDIRKDLNVPELPFVIGVMGVGGDQDPPTSNLGYFQQAQAAVADQPEFKDTVVNVRTGKYWDQELVALINNSGSSERLRNGDWAKATGPDGKPVWKEKPSYEDYRSYVLKHAKSEQGYHYFGSAKIMCGIGKAFAESMITLEDKAE